jgi:hypothetical protein
MVVINIAYAPLSGGLKFYNAEVGMIRHKKPNFLPLYGSYILMVVINITYAPLFYSSSFLQCGSWGIYVGYTNLQTQYPIIHTGLL